MRLTNKSVPLYALAIVLACGGSVGPPGAAQGTADTMDQAAGAKASPARWIAAWGATPEGSAVAAANSSVRNIARISVTGTNVRVRVSNPRDSETPLVIGAATIALQQGTLGAEVVPGTIRGLTFDGERGVTVPAGTDAVYSDPVRFDVEANQNVAVTLHLPAETNPDVGGAQWNTSYATPAGAGDLTRDETGATFSEPLSVTYGLTAIDVLTREANGAIVGLGSSTLHGSNSNRDNFDRVLDLFINRNQDEVPGGSRKGIVGAGIGGDTLHAAVDRLDRDVLSQSGVSGVVVWVTNDLLTRTAKQIIEDYEIVIARSHAAGVRVYCPTWIPGAQSLGAREERSKLNEWIMNSQRCDDTVDWDRTLRNDTLPDTFKAEYFSDGIHPNAAGHGALSAATPLRWFTAQPFGCGDDGTERCPINPKLRGKDNGAKADRLTVNGPVGVAGANVELYKTNEMTNKRVFVKEKTLNRDGDIRFKVGDKNGRRITQYQAVVKSTVDTKRASTNRKDAR